MEFEGLQDRVHMVKASVREENANFILNDQCKLRDKKAGDNIWSYTLNISANVPAGLYHFDFQCLNTDLDPIYIKGTVKDGMDECGSVILTVK